jgi:hypothetical protein
VLKIGKESGLDGEELFAVRGIPTEVALLTEYAPEIDRELPTNARCPLVRRAMGNPQPRTWSIHFRMAALGWESPPRDLSISLRRHSTTV